MVASLIIGAAVSEQTSFTARAPLDLHPEALADRANQLLGELGYTDEPAGTASGWTCCDQRAQLNLDRYEAEQRGEILASHRPAAISFWYRQHRGLISVLDTATGTISDTQPPNSEPGMMLVRTDATGRLLQLQVQPWQMPGATGPDTGSAESIQALFAAAGLDEALFQSVAAEQVPPMMAEPPLAWLGRFSSDRDEEVRVEAAFWDGKPVWFELSALDAFGTEDDAVTVLLGVAALGSLTIYAFAAIGSLFFARRNWRSGRIDYRGAAVATIALSVIDIAPGLNVTWMTLLFYWLIYIAIEPQIRRHWPDSLISWSRLSHGKLKNALVASHILAGVTAIGVFIWAVWPLLKKILPEVPGHSSMQLFLSGSIDSPTRFFRTMSGFSDAVLLLAGIVVARSLLRSLLTADVVVIVLFSPAPAASLGGSLPLTAVASVFLLAVSFVWLWLIRRFGFLSFMAVWAFAYLLFMPLQITGGRRHPLSEGPLAGKHDRLLREVGGW